MTPRVSADFVALAHSLADAARPIVARYFRTPFTIDDKSDLSPVTIADREAETAMRAILTKQAPEHGIYGEEHGVERPDADYVWVLDPIDGTRAFVTGLPIFGTLIALLHRGVPVLGVIDQPILKERWLGVAGQTSTFNGQPITVRACPSLERAYMYSTAPIGLREVLLVESPIPVRGQDIADEHPRRVGFDPVVLDDRSGRVGGAR